MDQTFKIYHFFFLASPVFLKKSPSLLIQKEGELVEVFCEATGSPIPTVAWFKDDKELVSSDRVLVLRNRVQIKKLRKLDVGIYICTFKNVVGSISHQVKLVIEGDCLHYIFFLSNNVSFE